MFEHEFLENHQINYIQQINLHLFPKISHKLTPEDQKLTTDYEIILQIKESTL